MYFNHPGDSGSTLTSPLSAGNLDKGRRHATVGEGAGGHVGDAHGVQLAQAVGTNQRSGSQEGDHHREGCALGEAAHLWGKGGM